MEPITLQSQLSKDQFVEINFWFLFKNKILWFFYAIMLFETYALLTTKNLSWKNDDIYLPAYLILFGILLPVFIYFAAKKSFDKHKPMGELKHFIFTDEKLEINGETTTMSSAWSNIAMAREKAGYFLIFPTKRTFHYVAKSGFADKYDIETFKHLIMSKGIKNNFKK